MPDSLERLRAVPLLSGLPDKELRQLLTHSSRIKAEPGRLLVKQGSLGEELWILLDGSLEVSVDGAVVDTVGPGSFFGELAVIDPATRDASVTVAAPSELLLIERRQFWELLKATPSLMQPLLVHLARRARRTHTS